MILLYHHVAPADRIPASWETVEGWESNCSPEAFEHQLLTLGRRGYQFIGLADLVDDVLKRGREFSKALVLTFDDGWLDNVEFALPVLKRLGATATFFITTRHIGNASTNSRRMSMDHVRELLRAGMTIGAHSRTHADLTSLPSAEAEGEIRGSKGDLEEALGVNIDFFAYPGGVFNRRIVELTRRAGYRAACSSFSPAVNTRASRFWLFRSTLTENLAAWSDYYRLNPGLARLLEFRVKRRLRKQLRVQLEK